MRRAIALLVVITATLVACSNDKQEPTLSSNAELPLAPAWLASRVPDNALAYIRVPSVFGLTSGPKNNALAPLMQSEAHVDWLNTVLMGLADNVAAEPGLESQIVQWVLRHQRSPVELLVAPIASAPNSAPGLTIVMQTDLTTNDAMTEALTALINELIPGGSFSGLDADGIGTMTGLPVPVVASFDAATSRLIIFGGAAATEERMVAARDILESNKGATPMASMEARIDDSGYGLFMWVNTGNALTMAQMFVPTEVMQPVVESGLDKAKSIAFGYGVSRGKTRLGFYADIPQGDGMRSLVPVPSNTLGLKTTAAPKLVSVIAIPELQDIKAIALASDQVTEDEWQEGVQTATDYLGTDAEAFYEILAGEVLYVQEAVGSYAALKIDKGARIDDALGEIAAKFELPFETRSIRGLDMGYLKLPSGPTDEISEALGSSNGDPVLKTLMQIYTRVGSHVFWVYEDGYMIVGDGPQVLIDRKQRGPKMAIKGWAEDTAQQDLERSLLGLAFSVDGLPRFAHQTYIATMPILADIAGIDLDIWSLPTADDLNLPERGTLAFNIITEADVLGAEFSFEHSPFDTLGGAGGALVAVAGAGIVAAVAIPAYQDYTIRAQVSEAFIASLDAKASVQTFYMDNRRYPNAAETAELGYNFDGRYAVSVSIAPDDGVIVVALDGSDANIAIQGSSIFLVPEVIDDTEVSWTCDSDMDSRYLPSMCRDEN